MKIGNVILGLSLIIGAVLTYEGVLADECDSILEHGVFNTYQNLDAKNFRNDLTNGFCNSSSTAKKESEGGGVGLVIPIGDVDIGLKGSYNSSEGSSVKNESCGNGKSNLNDDNYHKILSWTVAPEIVAAWSQCKSAGGGPYVDGVLRDNILVLTFKFRPIGNVTTAKLSEDLRVRGAICENMSVKKGTILFPGGITVQCSRAGSEAIIITGNTEFSGFQFFVPAAAGEVVVQEDAKRCLGRPPLSPQITPLPGSIVIAAPNSTELAPQGQGSGKPLPGFPKLAPGLSWCVINADELAPGCPKAACTINAISGSPCSCSPPDGSNVKGKVY